jgi:hypothetical protein
MAIDLWNFSHHDLMQYHAIQHMMDLILYQIHIVHLYIVQNMNKYNLSKILLNDMYHWINMDSIDMDQYYMKNLNKNKFSINQNRYGLSRLRRGSAKQPTWGGGVYTPAPTVYRRVFFLQLSKKKNVCCSV